MIFDPKAALWLVCPSSNYTTRVKQVQRWPWERSRRGKLQLRCVCSAAREALGRPRGRRGAVACVATRTAC